MVATEMLDELVASDLVDDPARSPAAEPLRAEITARRRRRWGKEATLAAVTLGALGGFGAITRTITGKGGNAFDRMIVRRIGLGRHPVSNAIVRGITFFGGLGGAAAVSIGSVWLARRTPRLASQVVIGALGGISAELLLKKIFRRQRPTLLPHLERVTSTSFPSGHSMAAASLYLSLAFVASRSRRLRRHRALMLTAAGGFATTIGATRVFLGVHWPTDVLGGLALGTAWACAAEAIFDLTGAERVIREAARPR